MKKTIKIVLTITPLLIILMFSAWMLNNKSSINENVLCRKTANELAIKKADEFIEKAKLQCENAKCAKDVEVLYAPVLQMHYNNFIEVCN